ncbi:M20 family metallopeptidase [Anaeromicrobium sediminis]|uniref:Amidohydrolase n=1 Tax=Anaeromicrobium sediminis TaxID=1478221 RepID=A0A267MJ45_9FIRM|nr:M20 family metallopeptidase [Anaeromicrobium sediminis]PAB59614.1 amidohydrolase [Anaeromicrobium sediminis]
MSFKERISELVDSKSHEFICINDKIWEFAEIRFQEHESAKLQMEVLKKEGFEVKKGLSGIDTAFFGSFGEGYPVIGILGEFDALSELSQKADMAVREPIVEGGNGHGCGHHTLGASSLASAVALKDYMKENNLKGTIRYYGCPAEESGGGKTFMVRDGYFKDVDVALTWHPSSSNCVLESGFLANVKVLFDFKGISAHAAASPELGRSALDAVELMNIGVNFLREHMIDEARIHYAITDAGGNSPNVVQHKAQVFYTIRALKSPQVQELFMRVKDIAKGAALMTGTEVTTRVVGGYSDYLANDTLSRIMAIHAKEVVNEIDYTDDELAYAEKFKNTLGVELKSMEKIMNLDKEAMKKPIMKGLLPPPKKLLGSSDVGDVSWVVPMAQFMGNCYALGTPAHSWQMVAQGKSSITHKGMIAAAKIMALTAAEVFQNPAVIDKIKEDHLENLDGNEYICPIADDVIPNQI